MSLFSPVILLLDLVTVLNLPELLKDVLKIVKIISSAIDTPKATTMLQLIKQGVTAIKLLVTTKTLPNSASLPNTTKAMIIEQPEPEEAKL